MASEVYGNPRSAALALTLAAVASACGPNRTSPPRMELDASVIAPLECVPNLDGRIEAAELAPAIGVRVSYLVNPATEPRDVALAGADLGGGRRRWDLGSDYASDLVAHLEARSVAGQWFEPSFSGASFAAPLDLGARALGVYRHADDGLYLLGVASPQSDPPEGRTLLVYETPILVFRFPLVVGASWISTGDVRGATLRGLPYAGSDTYETRVESAGELVLPDLTFTQALRVVTRVTISPAAGEPVSRRQTSFLFECFGEVARATSADGETSDDFTSAAELRRFGL